MLKLLAQSERLQGMHMSLDMYDEPFKLRNDGNITAPLASPAAKALMEMLPGGVACHTAYARILSCTTDVRLQCTAASRLEKVRIRSMISLGRSGISIAHTLKGMLLTYFRTIC